MTPLEKEVKINNSRLVAEVEVIRNQLQNLLGFLSSQVKAEIKTLSNSSQKLINKNIRHHRTNKSSETILLQDDNKSYTMVTHQASNNLLEDTTIKSVKIDHMTTNITSKKIST